MVLKVDEEEDMARDEGEVERVLFGERCGWDEQSGSFVSSIYKPGVFADMMTCDGLKDEIKNEKKVSSVSEDEIRSGKRENDVPSLRFSFLWRELDSQTEKEGSRRWIDSQSMLSEHIRTRR